MNPETAFLIAVIIAVCAVLTAGGTVLLVRLVSRGRTELVRRREAIAQSSIQVRHEAAIARDRIERATTVLGQMRDQGTSWDDEMERLTESLRTQRDSIERMTQGRLATFIRVARMVSKAAQFAFLWR